MASSLVAIDKTQELKRGLKMGDKAKEIDYVMIADSVSDDQIPNYLTRGKKYPAESAGDDGANLYADNGRELYVTPASCGHLSNGKWDVFYEEDEPANTVAHADPCEVFEYQEEGGASLTLAMDDGVCTPIRSIKGAGNSDAASPADLTPCERRGYKEGDEFVLKRIKGEECARNEDGSRVEDGAGLVLSNDDGTAMPCFRIAGSNYQQDFYIEDVERVEGPQNADLTPCERRGYKEGDEFELTQKIEGPRDHLLPLGTRITLEWDDMSLSPRFSIDIEGILRLWHVLLRRVKKVTPGPQNVESQSERLKGEFKGLCSAAALDSRTALEMAAIRFMEPPEFSARDLVRWKPGFRNKKTEGPFLVLETGLDILGSDTDSSSTYYREPLDTCVMFLEPGSGANPETFLTLYADSRRLQPVDENA